MLSSCSASWSLLGQITLMPLYSVSQDGSFMYIGYMFTQGIKTNYCMDDSTACVSVDVSHNGVVTGSRRSLFLSFFQCNSPTTTRWCGHAHSELVPARMGAPINHVQTDLLAHTSVITHHRGWQSPAHTHSKSLPHVGRSTTQNHHSTGSSVHGSTTPPPTMAAAAVLHR